jgi:streptomycin 6-kinase
VKNIASKLNLHALKPFPHLSYNYVLAGLRDNQPIILKIGLDQEGLKREALALRCFIEAGAVKVIAEEEGILLLQHTLPGTSLKNYFPNKEEETINIVCKFIQKLQRAHIPAHHNFPNIKDWLLNLDKELSIPLSYLKKA